MSGFEKIIHKLNEDVPIPEDIKANIEATISELPEKSVSRIKPNNLWKKTMVKVATVTGCVVVTSATIYSAAAYSGIADYLKKVWGRELSAEEMALVETDVEQNECLEETEVTPNIALNFNDYVNVKISEALCDNGQCIVEVVFTPAEDSKYMIIHNEEQLNENILDDAGENITLGEYVKETGMEILYANVSISEFGDYESVVTASDGAITYKDGSCHYVLSYNYPMKGQKKEFFCHLNVLGESTNNEFVSSQLEFTLCDRSQATTYVYAPEYKQEVEDSNTVIDKVVITKTELGLKCVTYYHLAEEMAEDEKMNFGTFIWILDEDGNRLEHNEGSAVGGSSKLTTISTKENSITWTDYYTNIEMPDVLLVQPHDVVNEEVYEPIKVYLSQTK